MSVARGFKPYVKNAKGVKVIDLATTVYDDLVFNLVYLFIVATAYFIYTNQLEYAAFLFDPSNPRPSTLSPEPFEPCLRSYSSHVV